MFGTWILDLLRLSPRVYFSRSWNQVWGQGSVPGTLIRVASMTSAVVSYSITKQLNCCYFLKLYVFIVRQSEKHTHTEAEREIFCLLVHLPGLSQAKAEPGQGWVSSESSIWVWGAPALGHSAAAFSRPIARRWIRNWIVEPWNGTPKGGWLCHWQHNVLHQMLASVFNISAYMCRDWIILGLSEYQYTLLGTHLNCYFYRKFCFVNLNLRTNVVTNVSSWVFPNSRFLLMQTLGGSSWWFK